MGDSGSQCPDGCVKPFYTLHETSDPGLVRRYYYKDMPDFQRSWMADELKRIKPSQAVTFREFCDWRTDTAERTDNITEVTIEG